MAKGKTKPKAKRTPKADAKKSDDKGRLLPDRKLVIELSKEFDRANNRNKQTRDGLGEAIDDAKDHGIDIQAFRMAKRFVKQAEDSPIGAAIRWENLEYYLEVLEFDKKIAPSMFKASDVRSGKKNGKQEAPLKAKNEVPAEREERPEEAPVH
jgi:hypothetical protein